MPTFAQGMTPKRDDVCPWCAERHVIQACPKVQEIEFYPTGQVKRVVFRPGQPEISSTPPRKLLQDSWQG